MTQGRTAGQFETSKAPTEVKHLVKLTNGEDV